MQEGDEMPAEGRVVLLFGNPEPERVRAFGLPATVKTAPVVIDELLKWFQSYKVDSIELSIEGSFKTGGITNLIVSAEGKGGMKVVLKPK